MVLHHKVVMGALRIPDHHCGFHEAVDRVLTNSKKRLDRDFDASEVSKPCSLNRADPTQRKKHGVFPITLYSDLLNDPYLFSNNHRKIHSHPCEIVPIFLSNSQEILRIPRKIRPILGWECRLARVGCSRPSLRIDGFSSVSFSGCLR